MNKKKTLSLICAAAILTSPQVIIPYSARNLIADAADTSVEFPYEQAEKDGITYNLYSDHAELSGINTAKVGDTIVIPDTVEGKPVTKIIYALSPCKNLVSVTFPDTVTEFPLACLFGCEKLTYVKLPAHIKELPISTFYNCKSLKSVTLPEELESIGPTLFQHCASLETVNIPASVQSIATMAFADCAMLKEITVNNPECTFPYGSVNQFIYNSYDLESDKYTYTGVIRGYTGSTAQKFAEKFNLTFEAIDGTAVTTTTAPAVTTTTTTAPEVTTTTATTTTAPAKSVTIVEPSKAGSSNAIWVCDYAFSYSGGTINSIVYSYTFNSPDVKVMKSELQIYGYKGQSIASPFICLEKDSKDYEDYTLVIKKATDTDGNDILPLFPQTEFVHKSASSVTTTAPVTTAPVTTTTTPGTPYESGDVDGNCIIDGRDATAVLTEYAKLSTGAALTFTSAQQKAADVNEDGIIDARDASILLTYYARTSAGKNISLSDLYVKKD